MWAPLAFGAYRDWPLGIAFLLVGLAAAAWLAAGLVAGRLEWRRTPLDLPVVLLLGLVGVQLALGNRALVAWALAPTAPVHEIAAPFPAPFLTVGSVTPRQTLASALVFAGYAAVYFLVVQTTRTRRQLGALVRVLLAVGAGMAFLGLLDYLGGETALLLWREHPMQGRLSATFVNPDHFAAWLAMLVALGLGWLTARASSSRGTSSLGATLTVRELREQATRRYLPLLGVVVMAIALVFTLSRGGLVNLVVALLTLILLLGAVGRARRSLVLTGVLLLAVVAYGGWIGFGPLLARLAQTPGSTTGRVQQYVASLPMLREFPVLGVGLGAYRDIYFRHQPLSQAAGRVSYPFAHNDLLELALELGVVGAALCLFLGWRIVSDLIGVHLLGRGACPVDGGEGPEGMRSDRYSLGVAVGALAGLAGFVAHSALDFSARIPAVGFLAAALLGLATVALHTRLNPGHEQLLSGVATLRLPPGRALAAGAVALLALAAWSWSWIHLARVSVAERALADAPAAVLRARAEAVLALDRASAAALDARARSRQAAALALWQAPAAPGADRDRLAREGLARARDDLRAALRVSPTNPWLHMDLAWVEASDAVVQGREDPEGLAAALTHGSRAVTLGADTPMFYAAMARLAYSVPELGLVAAREAVARDPDLLGEMIDLYRPLGLTPAEWLALTPATAVDRLQLATLLDARGLRADALVASRAALTAASPGEAALCRWALAGALVRAGAGAEAVRVLREAVAAETGNPELERALGVALAAAGDPEALDHLRLAVGLMERRAGATEQRPFPVRNARLARLLDALTGDLAQPRRYRLALADYLSERRLWEQALPEWRQLAAADPNDARARFELGVAHEASGAGDAALEDFRAAVALDGRTPRYRRRLAERLWQSEQYFQALNEWRTLIAQDSRDVEARLALARGLEKVGQPADAYREYRELLRIEPGQADATRAVARLEGRRR